MLLDSAPSPFFARVRTTQDASPHIPTHAPPPHTRHTKQHNSAAQIDDEEDEAMIMDGLSASMADVTQKVSELGKNLADNLLKVFGAKK